MALPSLLLGRMERRSASLSMAFLTRLMAWAQMLDVRRATSDEITAGLRISSLSRRIRFSRLLLAASEFRRMGGGETMSFVFSLK